MRNTLLLLVALSAACVKVQVTPSPSASQAQIRARLDSTAAGWNRGDFAAYMAMYDTSVTANGLTGIEHGRAKIEETMRAGFWRTGRPLQQLRYDKVEIRMLGADYALVTGQFVLTGADRPQRTGLFSTVWHQTPQGWVMIHDHSG